MFDVGVSSLAEPYVLHLAGLTHALTVRAFRGREALSSPTVFDLDVLTSRKVTAASGSLLGRAAAFSFYAGNAHRRVHGVITSQRVAGHPARGDLRLLRVRLSSRLWALSRRSGSRIYQNTSAVEVATQVFRSVGVQVEARLDTRPHVLEYCVQYRETELDFVRRILAEHGVAFALRAQEESEDALDDPTRADLADATLFGADVGDVDASRRVGVERVVLFDHPTAWRDPAVPLTFVGAVEDRAGVVVGVTDFAQHARVRPTRVSTRSYDPRQPTADLVTHADASRPNTGAVDLLGVEVFDHRDEYLEPLPDRFRARVTLDGLRARAEESEGRATTPALEPATRFSLDGHREAEFNREYLVTTARHEGRVGALTEGNDAEAAAYECRFRCVASGVNPRPRHRPRPVAQVMETAVVVGHEEGVCSDPAGRVRVRFNWDRRASASTAWLRVAQQWAGAHYGAQFLPRTGTEVLVSFLDGDPDRPMIVAALHNAAQPMPFNPVAERARSGWRSQSIGADGHNELSFDDTAGAEELHLRAQRDLVARVLRDHVVVAGRDARAEVAHDRVATVHNDDHVSVAHDRRSEVARDDHARVGRDRHTHVSGNTRDEVAGEAHRRVRGAVHAEFEGEEWENVRGDAHRHVRGDAVTQVGTHDAPRSWMLYADDYAALHATRDLELKADETLTLRVGRSVLRMTPERIELASPEIRLSADHTRVTMGEGRASIDAEERVVVNGARVVVAANGASLRLDANAALEGAQVQLNSASVQGDRARERGAETTRICLVDDQGRALPARVFVLRTRDGREYLGITGRDGRAEVDVPDGGSVRFLDHAEVE